MHGTLESLRATLEKSPGLRELGPDLRVVDNLELLDVTIAALKKVPHEVRIDLCELSDDGDMHLALVAPGLAREVREGDYIYGGFYLTNSATTDTEASVRIFRVACRNGALADAVEGQRLVLPRRIPNGAPDPYPTWKLRLSEVVERSFDGGALDEETERFRRTTDEMLASPYEWLLNLVAQGIISEDEQSLIQRAFDEGRDSSLYGFVNAVTSIAHRFRGNSDWVRAMAMERLGGEIVRGDHQPPVGAPVWT